MRPPLSLPIYSLLGLSIPSTAHLGPEQPLKNVNHVFNVIHDSMRQWGSSLHHNGVSFFLATVPAGTQFYHGTSASTPVNGTEWLAFEPEHAMVFARPFGPPPGDGDRGKPHGSHRDELRRREGPGSGDDPLPHLEDNEEGKQTGYLHTYAAAKDLRLLYIDGMSAAKSSKGTLDSQDILLFNRSLDTSPKKGPGPGPGPGGESERAVKACEMAEKEWAGRIDGVLRMEAGFEIILCAFERDLTPIQIIRVPSQPAPKDKHGPGHDGKDGPGDGGKRKDPPPGGPDSSRWMRAVTARYEGIGGSRVSLNYEHFVTAFEHDVDLFQNDSVLPRLDHLSSSELDAIRKEINTLVLTHDAREGSWDWQATTDMIVTRYSDELSYLSSGKITTLEELRSHIGILLSPFIDHRERNPELETGRCATQFLPLHAQHADTLAARAVHSVAHRICSTLIEAWAETQLVSAVKRVQSLTSYLDWTTWKACRGCQDNEICVVPIWPMGTVADYEHPSCKPALKPFDRDGEGYWGGMHG